MKTNSSNHKLVNWLILYALVNNVAVLDIIKARHVANQINHAVW